MSHFIINLWFDNQAEQVANFYTEIFKDSKITQINKYLVETPSKKEIGSVMTVSFELLGTRFIALNGGPNFKINPLISFIVQSDSINEIKLYWEKISDESTILMPLDSYPFSEQYGWLQDKFGISWQFKLAEGEISQKIVPKLTFVGSQCGNAESAMNYYCSIFMNSKIGDLLKYEAGELPDEVGTIKHGEFFLKGTKFAAMDSALNHKFTFNEAIAFIVECQNQEEIDNYWDKLSFAKESEQCGWIKDKFGISWIIQPKNINELLFHEDENISIKAMEALLKMKKIDLQVLEKFKN
jgi:predicted 3-demethylubiquinone-9 3-methyltransferase (glyoxalase superfamily)